MLNNYWRLLATVMLEGVLYPNLKSMGFADFMDSLKSAWAFDAKIEIGLVYLPYRRISHFSASLKNLKGTPVSS